MEVFHRFFVGKGGSVDVPFSGRAVGWGNFFSGNTGKDGNQFVQADFCLGTEVVAGVGVFGGQCQSDAPGNVAGVDEVSGLLTVSEDGNILSFSKAFGKDTDNAAFSPIALALAVYIGETEYHVVDTEGQAVEGQVFFYGHFGQAIEGKGYLRERFLHRQGFFVHVAIGGSGGGSSDCMRTR